MHSGNTADPSGFNPRSAAFRANPYPVYRALQSTAPVYRRQTEGDWLITRYRDVEGVLKSQEFGRAGQSANLSALNPGSPSTLLEKLRTQSLEVMAGWAVLQNPPEHTVLRTRMRILFNADHLHFYDDLAKSECSARLSSLKKPGQFDLIEDIAFPVAMRVSAAILGIAPKEFSPHFRAWSDGLGRLTDLQPSHVSGEQGLMAIAALSTYFRRLLSTRSPRENPGLIDYLWAESRDKKLREIDALSMLTFMFAVAHSSTVNLIGNSVLSILNHPIQHAALLDDPQLLDQAITEVLRYESPVQSISRTALVDTQIAATPIRRGETVHLVIGAANRDPEVFSDPDRLDILREEVSNLSFGSGIHTCIGLRLARATTSTVLKQILHLHRVVTLNEERREWDEPYLGRGLKSLRFHIST